MANRARDHSEVHSRRRRKGRTVLGTVTATTMSTTTADPAAVALAAVAAGAQAGADPGPATPRRGCAKSTGVWISGPIAHRRVARHIVPGPQTPPTVEALLGAAVAAVPGGIARTGQQAMAAAVTAATQDREHLLVQAGTGTGKSLAYLVPALLVDGPVVISTATLALQHQLIDHDLPRLVD